LSRLVSTAVLVFLWTGVTAAGDVAPRRFVDLSEPGALEALRQSNPTHFEKVRQIIRQPHALEALQQSNPTRFDKEARQIIESCVLPNVNARDVMFGPYLASYPEKRYLRFTLDGTRYAVFVTAGVTDIQRLQSCFEQQRRLDEGATAPSPK
jgi:hypothetical protein